MSKRREKERNRGKGGWSRDREQEHSSGNYKRSRFILKMGPKAGEDNDDDDSDVADELTAASTPPTSNKHVS